MNRYRLVFVFAFALLWSAPTWALVSRPQLLPADRLIANTEAWIAANPAAAASGHITLARIHYICFYNRASSAVPYYARDFAPSSPSWIPMDYPGTGPDIARQDRATSQTLREFGMQAHPDYKDPTNDAFRRRWDAVYAQLEKEEWLEEPLNAAQAVEHARLALVEFRTAIQLDPQNPEYRLNFASFIKQWLDHRDALSKELGAPPTGDLALLQEPVAIYGFRIAFFMADESVRNVPYSMTGVKKEAARRYIELVEKQPSLSKTEKANLKLMHALLKRPPKRPEVADPIAFSISPVSQMSDLQSANVVAFDLLGAGRADRWQWLKPTTALLVWDPDATGKIASGRQLFGNATWWLFFEDGYRALDALDDNRDGQLAGAELKGIAAWFDRNSNGVSDPGEVVTLASLGIQSIATRPAGRDGNSLMNPAGIRLDSGRTLPTWDWIAEPAR